MDKVVSMLHCWRVALWSRGWCYSGWS